MWHNHPFSQRIMTTEKAMGWGLKVTGKWEQEGGMEGDVGSIGVFIK